MDFGVWILDFGFWILDLGFWILDFGFWILEFGVWILDFGFWSLDFGFWILDQFSLRSFCGGPKRRRLDFGVWSLDFGFWILDFGFGLGVPCIVWILHKIFPCHADSGRRIYCFLLAVSFPLVLWRVNLRLSLLGTLEIQIRFGCLSGKADRCTF